MMIISESKAAARRHGLVTPADCDTVAACAGLVGSALSESCQGDSVT